MELMQRYDAELTSLLEFAEQRVTNGPSWLTNLRARGLASHREHGIPTPKNEEWKYTPLRPLTTKSFSPSEPGPAVFDFRLPFFCDGTRIVLVNGRFDRNQVVEKKTKGLTVKSLRDAISEDESLLSQHLGQIGKSEPHT